MSLVLVQYRLASSRPVGRPLIEAISSSGREDLFFDDKTFPSSMLFLSHP